MDITIAGYGFVGKAHAMVLNQTNKINVYDPALGMHDFGEPHGVIICVSTPARRSGGCDMRNVRDVISRTSEKAPILIRSTISIEGWRDLRKEFPNHEIAFAPEFLRAATALEDFKATDKMYIGGDRSALWHTVFRIAFNDSSFTTVPVDAEVLILGKYFRNSYLATKVSFFNQVYDMCEAWDVDYEMVAGMVGKDERIGTSHTEVTEQRGYGGHCFPKDVSAILSSAKRKKVDLSILKEAQEYNRRIRKDT